MLDRGSHSVVTLELKTRVLSLRLLAVFPLFRAMRYLPSCGGAVKCLRSARTKMCYSYPRAVEQTVLGLGSHSVVTLELETRVLSLRSSASFPPLFGEAPTLFRWSSVVLELASH